jgi:glycerophosphoryl diester phosphodiesterase
MIECDVKLSADGVPFLLHDATLERTTNGQGLAGEQVWAKLARLDAGAWHSPIYAGEPMPTLTRVAAWCLAQDCCLNIEIKPTPGTEAQTGREVARAAAQLWASSSQKPLLTSFQQAALAQARAVAPELPRGLLLDQLAPDWLASARNLGCAAVVLRHPLWTAATVDQARRAGLRTLAYTVNAPADVQRLQALGLDSLITDCLDLFQPD